MKVNAGIPDNTICMKEDSGWETGVRELVLQLAG